MTGLFDKRPNRPEDAVAIPRTPGERMFFALSLTLNKAGDEYLRNIGWGGIFPHEKEAWEEAAKMLGIEPAETEDTP